MKKLPIAMLCASLLLAALPAAAGETLDKVKETGKEVGSAVKETATEIGHSVRDAAIDVADSAVEAGHEIKKEFSDDKKKKKAEKK